MKKIDILKKRLNTIWKYGTLIAIIMVALTVLVVAIANAYSNKQQLVLTALNKYNTETLGYQKSDSTSRSLALDKSVKLSLKSNQELVRKIQEESFNVELLEYFNLCLLKVESYQGSIESLSQELINAEIDAWVIEQNGVYYYGSLADETTSTPEVYNSTTDSLDSFMAEFKGVLKDSRTILINSENFGVFFVTSSVCQSFNNDSLEDIDQLLAIIRIMKCGYPTNALDTIMTYYDTIINNS